MSTLLTRDPGRQRQTGVALLIMLVLLVMAALALFLTQASSAQLRAERDRKTAEALSIAKAALIGRAVTDDGRPGSLPCPDIATNMPAATPPNVPGDGIADMLSGNDCPSYVGWLPWKTLGLPDIRDSSGEHLWYALSPSLRDDSSAQPINSDTAMQLTLDSATGNVAAIIFAPGAPVSGQTRPSNNVADYLEGVNLSLPNNYVSGPQSSTFNDRLVTINRDELFQVIEGRVAREAVNCLSAYATANQGRFPWAAPVTALDFADAEDVRFGRIPTDLDSTHHTNSHMSSTWPPSCAIQKTWWLANRWSELVFYGLAQGYAPDASPVGCPSCLTVNPPSASANKRVAIIVAGRSLVGQLRGSTLDKEDVSNYLELNNADGNDIFTLLPRTATFNDTVIFLQ